MNIDLANLIAKSLHSKGNENSPEPYYTGDEWRSVAVPKEYEGSGIARLDAIFHASGVPWRYEVNPDPEVEATYPMPQYLWIKDELQLLPLALYPEKRDFAHSLAHELAHASGIHNPNVKRPSITKAGIPARDWTRGVEEAQADLAALLVLNELGNVTEKDIARVVNYITVWTENGVFSPGFSEFFHMPVMSRKQALEKAATYAKETAEWMLGLAR